MIRKTSQRDAIQEVFTSQDRPLGIEDVLEYGRAKVASLNQATVYRNLKALVEKGWLNQIVHPSLGTMYERTGKGHHHHFHCHTCNQLYDLPGCPLSTTNITPAGFVVDSHDIFLSGVCSSCNKLKTQPDPANKRMISTTDG